MKTASEDIFSTCTSTHFVPTYVHRHLLEMEREPSAVVHTYNPFVWRAKAGELGIKAPLSHSETILETFF